MCDCCNFIAARGGRPNDPALLAEYERILRFRIRANLDARGVSLMGVEGWPPFSYTIGLTAIGHPELVIFGLEPQICQPILNEIADYVIFQDMRIGSGDEVDVANWRFLSIAVPNPADVVVRANDFYRRPAHNSVPALQLVYPDVHGVWPWEPHCHLFPGQQPLPGEFPGADEPRSA